MNEFVFYMRGRRDKPHDDLLPWSFQFYDLSRAYGNEMDKDNFFVDEMLVPGERGYKKYKDGNTHPHFERMLKKLKENKSIKYIVIYAIAVLPTGASNLATFLKDGYTVLTKNAVIQPHTSKEETLCNILEIMNNKKRESD